MPDEQFQRQRRNLVLMSSLVMFVNAVGGRISKISLLGNEFTLSNPDAMPTILGIALGYLLLRYIQYAHELENKGFKDRFLQRVETYLRPYLLNREHARSNSELSRAYPDKGMVEVESLTMFHKAMRPNTAAVSFAPKDQGAVIDENELHVSNAELIWPFIRSSFYILIRTRLATDFVFPPILAFLAYATYLKPVRDALSVWL